MPSRNAWIPCGTSVIAGILSNREYTGAAVLNRKTSQSYKDHRKYIKPEDEWIIHENAHPAIIDDQTLETVQRIRSNRRQVQRKTYDKGALRRKYLLSRLRRQAVRETELALKSGRLRQELLLLHLQKLTHLFRQFDLHIALHTARGARSGRAQRPSAGHTVGENRRAEVHREADCGIHP